jgi:hypothetical protein
VDGRRRATFAESGRPLVQPESVDGMPIAASVDLRRFSIHETRLFVSRRNCEVMIESTRHAAVRQAEARLRP